MSFQDDGVVCSLKHYVRERAHLLLLAVLLGFVSHANVAFSSNALVVALTASEPHKETSECR